MLRAPMRLHGRTVTWSALISLGSALPAIALPSAELAGSGTCPGAASRREASSSGLIAMAGMLVLQLSFGIFALYSFGMTCSMPKDIGAVTQFL